MLYRFYYAVLDDHTHVSIYAGLGTGSLAQCGGVVMSTKAWEFLKAGIERTIGTEKGIGHYIEFVAVIECLPVGGSANTGPVAGREKPKGEPASAADAKAERLSVSNNRQTCTVNHASVEMLMDHGCHLLRQAVKRMDRNDPRNQYLLKLCDNFMTLLEQEIGMLRDATGGT